MKHILTIFLLFILFEIFSVSYVQAHPGNTDYQGCHTCRTNCTDWGLYYGEYHCHTPKYTTPTCPLNSSYNSISGSCECYSGYTSSGGSCISLDQSCRNQLGYSSRYNTLTDRCECTSGNVIDSSGKCSSGNSYCWSKYGYNSRYNSLNSNCECGYGYVFNKLGNKCISEDESCKEQYGYGSKSTISGDKCECIGGYVFEGGKCVIETIKIQPVYKSDTTPNSITPPSGVSEEFINEISNSDSKEGLFPEIWGFIITLLGF